MIKIICGGIGSGKTLKATKSIIDSHYITFGNYKILNKNNYHRLKFSDIILQEDKNLRLNWEFWKTTTKKYGGFNIVLDEIHNIMHSRRSMSKNNIILSQWVAQIRKVLGSSEKHDFICISQETDRIDSSIRDLTNEIVYCDKFISNTRLKTKVQQDGKTCFKELNKVWVFCYHFLGSGCLNRYNAFRIGGAKTYDYVSYFLGNPYFQFYDSYEMIDFGDETFL